MNSIICVFLVLFYLKPSFCNDQLKISDLEEPVQKQLWELINYPFFMKPDCIQPNPVIVKFFLFNREVAGKEIDPETPENIGTIKKTVVLIHGWLSSSKSSKMIALKNAYLERYDCNVVMVDWSETAFMPYTRAACDNPVAGSYVSKFFCTYSQRTGHSLEDFHVIGHSIGGHLAGVVGYNLRTTCNQTLGRITGLDPTYVLFFRIEEQFRLDKSDALFVDVILTHSGYFGYIEPIGHVHFSPNCALKQPGCLSPSKFDNSTLLTDAMCSHLRSIDYMTESVNSQQLIAVSCSLCPRYCHKDISSQVYQVMGEDCRKIPKPAKHFLIPTASASPYGLGMSPYKKLFYKKKC